MASMVQFHDLVGLIDAKIAEITDTGGPPMTDEDTEVCNYLTQVRDAVKAICEQDVILPSYVYRR